MSDDVTSEGGQPSGSPPAGWYPDSAVGGLRWWDGEKWTDHTHVAETATAPTASPAPDSEDKELTIPGWAVGLAALALVVLVAAFAISSLSGDESDKPSPVAEPEGAKGDDEPPTPAESKAQGSESSTIAHVVTAQTAMETYATDHEGSYEGATAQELLMNESTLPSESLVVESVSEVGYRVSVTDPDTGTTFAIERGGEGDFFYFCSQPGKGLCSQEGTWTPGG